MDSKTLSTIQALKHNNMQNTMRDNNTMSQSSNINSRLAISFYNFLVGKSNKLQTPEYIDTVKKATTKDHKTPIAKERPTLISVACGMNVFMRLIVNIN